MYVQVDPQRNRWTSAIVTKTPVASQPRSYRVETTNEAQLVTNGRFIGPAEETGPLTTKSNVQCEKRSSSERPRPETDIDNLNKSFSIKALSYFQLRGRCYIISLHNAD